MPSVSDIVYYDQDVDNSIGIHLLSSRANTDHNGNGFFRDMTLEVSGENSIGIYLDASKGVSWLNLLEFSGFHITGHYTSQTGIYLNCTDRTQGVLTANHFSDFSIELYNGIVMESPESWTGGGQMYDLHFDGFFLGCSHYNIYAHGYGFYTQNTFSNGILSGAGTQQFTNGGGTTMIFDKVMNQTAYTVTGGGFNVVIEDGMDTNAIRYNTDDIPTLTSTLNNLQTSGLTTTVTVKENVAPGDVLFLNSTGYFKANAVSTSKMNAVAMSTQTISANGNCIVLLRGYFRCDTWSSLTVGTPIYTSNSTSGAISQTISLTTGNVVENLGYAVSTKTVWFAPNQMVIVVN